MTSYSKLVGKPRPEAPFPNSHTLLPSLSLSDLHLVPVDSAQLDTEMTRGLCPA